MARIRGYFRRVWSGFALTLAVGCATATRHGVVVMKIDETEAHIGLGRNDVKPGDQLTLSRYVCSGQKNPVCHRVTVGSGGVVRLLNEMYSVAEFRAEAGVKEGDFVTPARSAE